MLGQFTCRHCGIHWGCLMSNEDAVAPSEAPMTIEQLRVDVARDVLKLLKLEQLVPTCGTYFYALDGNPAVRELGSRELQSELLTDPMACEVCALGLSALSLVRLNNHVDGDELCDEPDDLAREALGYEWASMIEAAFEDWTYQSPRSGRQAKSILSHELNARSRAQQIMEAAIDSGGDEEELREQLFGLGKHSEGTNV